MDIEELKNIWQAYDNKLAQSIRINMHCLELIQSQKAKSKLNLLLFTRLIEIAAHIVIICYLGNFLYFHFTEVQFALSAVILILFFIIAFINCSRQVIIILEIDYSKNITEIQRKLTILQSYIANYIRLTFLMLPTYLAYPIIAFKVLGNFDIVSQLSHKWWIAQIIFTILLIPVCIWLYKEVSYKNMHKKWVRFIIEKSAGTTVTKAMDFIKEIDEFKKG
ncbi:MAG TPA: hypothetical protein VGO09_08855 [Flavisolibacter sp.]|nr:hypothetical protein [Flavisolibacter sp.]